MPLPLSQFIDGQHIGLPARDGMRKSVHVIDQKSLDAIRAALVTGRPLLVRGDPGTGKSQLARAAAVALKRAFLSHAVDARTETRDLLWTVDVVSRLACAQMLGAVREGDAKKVAESVDVTRFLRPGPLWWAFNWASAAEQARLAESSAPVADPGEIDAGVVLLVDEIDKADSSVPNALLDALGHGRFDVPGGKIVTLNGKTRPLLVITTNDERVLPDAFLRRCWVLHLELDANRDKLVSTLVERGKAHHEELGDLLFDVANMLADDREKVKARGLTAPGVAEYIDVLDALHELADTYDERKKLLARIGEFAFDKHPREPFE
ncbi:MAG: MoxR family ATPase [Minicystis sp.]